jgi:hypothetical protein
MPQTKLNVPLPNLGLVVDRPGEYVDPRAVTNCQNMAVKSNEISQRNGSEAVGTSLGEQIMGMSELESGIYTYFVRVGLTKTQVLDKDNETWSNIHHTTLSGSADFPISFAFPLISAVKHMVYTNYNDNIRKYNGTGNDADLGGSPPKAKYLLDFGTYLVLAHVIDGGTTYPSRVQWSDTGDPENWSTGSAGSKNLLEDSLEITGLNRFGEFICVHKESAIYLGQLVDTSEKFRFSRKETGVGTIANGSIQNLPDGTQIFLARDGLRLFNGITTSLIPSPIIDELRDSMSPQYVHKAVSVLVRDLDEYWVGIPIGSQTLPETIYKYNYRTGQVYKDPYTNLSTMSLMKRVSDEAWDDDSDSWDSDISTWDDVEELALHRQVMFGDISGNTMLRTTATNDGSTAIDSIWDTKDFTIDDVSKGFNLGQLVRWLGIDIWAKGNSVTLYYSTDSGVTWTKVRKASLDSSYPSDDDPEIFYFDVLSSKIRFRFRNSSASESWTMKKYSLEFVPRERRK